MRELHIVEGTGGSRRTRERAVAAIFEHARAGGWTPVVLDLAALPDRLDDIGRLVLCGGDGLVHQAVQHVSGSDVEVAVVPVGTGNDFARDFGIGAELAAALAASEPGTAEVRQVDLLLAEPPGAWAASVLTAGYSGRVTATANAMRLPLGSAKYTVAALLEIGRLRPFAVQLTVTLPDGTVQVLDSPLTLLAIGNTSYFGGGMRICPRAQPSDATLDLVAVGPIRRTDFVRWLPKVFRGSHLDHPAVTAMSAAAITIETDEGLWADGEPFVPAPLSVRAAPRALRLLVPAGGPVDQS